MSTDPRVVAAAWVPQYPGRRATKDIQDPIVEPDWGGVRAVAAIADGKAELYRYGDRIDVPPSLEEALGYAFEAVDGVIEGHLTTQAFDTGIGAFPAQEPVSRPILSLPKFFKRSASTDPYVYGRRQQADEEARAPEVLEELASGVDHAFVAIDLLWLDGQPLDDLPLLERKRLLDTVLAQSRLVRVTPFVRPGGSRMANTWGTLGFENVSWRAANERYTAGKENPDWAIAPAPAAPARAATPPPAEPVEPKP
jgi:ATP-dependent DNA ligase